VAARPQSVSVVYLAAGDTGPALAKLRELCAARKVSVEERGRAELDALVGGGAGDAAARHQGVVAVAGELEYGDLHDVLGAARARHEAGGAAPLLVVLDGIQDPHNLGAIVRSACVLGADAVVIAKDRAVQVTPTVVKASAGATEHLPIVRVTNLVRALEDMKVAGLWSYAAVADADADAPWGLDLTGPVALVMGTEGKGLRPLVAKTCDFRVRIPMPGQALSLNVSVATGTLLYEVLRQRSR
jgi:23S rRNA (guanosine2251-2'-O)-methyltransferase